MNLEKSCDEKDARACALPASTTTAAPASLPQRRVTDLVDTQAGEISREISPACVSTRSVTRRCGRLAGAAVVVDAGSAQARASFSSQDFSRFMLILS